MSHDPICSCCHTLRAARHDLAEARENLTFLRDGWSEFGGRGCPACVYDNGRFIRPCKLHAVIEERDARIAALTEALRKFGQHTYGCASLGTQQSPMNAFAIVNAGPCNCGLQAALAPEPRRG